MFVHTCSVLGLSDLGRASSRLVTGPPGGCVGIQLCPATGCDGKMGRSYLKVPGEHGQGLCSSVVLILYSPLGG